MFGLLIRLMYTSLIPTVFIYRSLTRSFNRSFNRSLMRAHRSFMHTHRSLVDIITYLTHTSLILLFFPLTLHRRPPIMLQQCADHNQLQDSTFHLNNHLHNNTFPLNPPTTFHGDPFSTTPIDAPSFPSYMGYQMA
jgi:hypothetical protein